METIDAIVHLARTHGCGGARCARRFTRQEDAMAPVHWDRTEGGNGDDTPLRLPCFRIWRDGGHLRARGVEGSAAGHDNEPRLPHLCAWLERRVLPYMSTGRDEDVCCGFYRVELHDSYSYLSTTTETAGDRYRDAHCLTFSRARDERRASVSLLPDPYQMDDYGGMLSAHVGGPWRDRVRWEDKEEDRVLFAGSTTGERAPARNVRVRACAWAAREENRAVADFRLTQVVQMPPDALRDVLGPHIVDRVLRPNMSPAEQYRFKYIANIAGNTCCWSRVPMLLASNSLMFDVPGADMTWYHPLLHAGEHFVSAPIHRLAAVRAECMSDGPRCRRIVQSANRFASTYLDAGRAALYTRALLEALEE